jgi:hypothetical protein
MEEEMSTAITFDPVLVFGEPGSRVAVPISGYGDLRLTGSMESFVVSVLRAVEIKERAEIASKSMEQALENKASKNPGVPL